MKIFISHASADKRFARKLRKELEKYGYRTWFDEEDIDVGDSIYESIQLALDMCDFIIIIFSKISLTREWVKKEIVASFNKEIKSKSPIILPILKDNVEIPLLLRDKKFADFRTSFSIGLSEVLKSLNQKNFKYKRIPRVLTVKHKETLEFGLKSIKKVHFKKYIKYRCLGSKLSESWEYFTTDGTIKNIILMNAKLESTYFESAVLYCHVLFNKTILKNAEYSYHIMFDLINSFNGKTEYWALKGNGPSESISIKVIFPINKPPKNWWVEERDRGLVRKLDENAKLKSVGGRKVLQFEIEKPPMDLQYVLKWEW